MGRVAFSFAVPPEQRGLVEALLARLSELAGRLTDRLVAEDLHYRRVALDRRAELCKVCEVNLDRALRAVLDGEELAVDAAQETGRVQARLGIPLASVLRSFRIAGAFVFEALLEQAGSAWMETVPLPATRRPPGGAVRVARVPLRRTRAQARGKGLPGERPRRRS
ncbi:hypothetical protein ORV05_07280 [Amycolatopsis cynarae]|uniref:RsbT co-antagonist protein RsbRD N-terminal domain-containing protein n=1 Tax=Amycolatopsis cynarae TaxID=2995223 RepID=A0ABY7B9N8_9PSEU|nr:hypothetical protein [Amycolatopsis sp. HUAS 11-8]WAL67576.1 hypothetical protein ORV05_07280 [Amycolatopsis sp. HUAS 11-8]